MNHWAPTSIWSVSENYKIVLVRRDLRRSLIEAPAQSRVSSKVRPDCPGLYPGRFGNLQESEMHSLSGHLVSLPA